MDDNNYPDSNPIAFSTLSALLQLGCLVGSTPCLLAYCDLKPDAKAAPAAAACQKGSSSSNRARTPAANGTYPDPDLISDDHEDDAAAAAFKSPLTSPVGNAAAAAAAAKNGDAFEECISSSSSGFVSPTASSDLAAGVEYSSTDSSSAQGRDLAAALEAAAADISSSAAEGSSSFGSADAAAAAAAAQWTGSPLHLSLCVALGPLFEKEQQGPCLTRLMELLVQYYADTNAAAQQLGSVLEEQLRQQQGSSNYGRRYGCSRVAAGAAAAAKQGARDLPGDSRLLVLLMGLYHLEMRKQQQQQQQHQQWLMQQQLPNGRPAHRSSSSVYEDQDIRLASCQAASLMAAHVSDLLWYCTLQPDATAGLSSSSSSSKSVCPIAAELMHEHLNLQHRFIPEDNTLLDQVPPVLRHNGLLGYNLEGLPNVLTEPLFSQNRDCWRALSETCDGCGIQSSTQLRLCLRCECAVLCVKCISSGAHSRSTHACEELADLHDSLVAADHAKGIELCRCDNCLEGRWQAMHAFKIRPRFSPLQQLLVPWQHWLQQQQQQRVRPSSGWLRQRQQDAKEQQQQQQGRLLLPVTVLAADQARELHHSPVAVCRDAEQARLRQYNNAWLSHMTMLQTSMNDVLSENPAVRLREEQRLQKEGQKDSSKSAAASAAAAGAAAGAAAAAGFFNAASAGFMRAVGGGWRQQQQQRRAGVGSRFGAKPFQGVGLSDDKLFGLD
jgi:hypothetical protein